MGLSEYLRSAVFGIEDALVSTTGAVVGLTAGASDKSLVLLAALIVVAVEAVSMSAGQFLSEETMIESQDKVESKSTVRGIVNAAAIMFVSYFVAGMVPIVPVLLFPFPVSIVFSLVFALIALFSLGFIKGKIVRVSPVKSAVKMLVLGGVAAIVGVLVGFLLRDQI